MYGQRPLTMDNVLDLISQYDIFKFYIPSFKALYVPFRSELRNDKNPGCTVIATSTDKLYYRDYAANLYVGCFKYVMLKYGVDFNQALNIVNNDFGLGLAGSKTVAKKNAVKYSINLEEVKKDSCIISVKFRKWNLADKEFWNTKLGLTSQDLKAGHVYPLSGFRLNDTYCSAETHCYGYYFGRVDGIAKWKIYQPYSKDAKWRGNAGRIIQGYSQLPESGDRLIVTKSYKDVLVLRKAGYTAIAPQMEGAVIPEEILEDLKKRFTNIIILYDNDDAGKKATMKLAEDTGFPYFYYPEGTKDTADFIEAYWYDELKDYIEKCWSQAMK